ncbi:zinc ABC transporter substrate-binding protein [Paracoccus albus]|uniref:zinc ABC transporter substrate-binding protein n=1 Tax=Paracoccus albus TaxID=3017784 RepID=UPI0022F10FEB|nr:zinc ABC transporter substrate-binding protein [Paracoccus albus]WBU60788.1 zinc ABC transporter substrate-binding protein [Paracoccus albus]
MRAYFLMGLAFTPAHALAEAPQVLTDMPVTASLVQQVMGNERNVDSLLDAQSDPHDFQLRPSQAKALQDTDLLVWIGPEMTIWLADAANTLGADRQMQLLHQPGTHLRQFGSSEDDHSHTDEDHEGEDHHHDHEDGHEHTGTDPHAWLDPKNGQLWLTLIAERLAQMDPENAETYRDNAAAAAETIESLDAEITTELAGSTEQPFVTFHDAYGYFTDHYGMPAAITVSIGDASAPSASRIREVREMIDGSGATCALTEAGQSPRMIEAVIDGTDLQTGGEISPNGAKIDAGPMLYQEILRQLSQRISACSDMQK